jgi:hypothetical protein
MRCLLFIHVDENESIERGGRFESPCRASRDSVAAAFGDVDARAAEGIDVVFVEVDFLEANLGLLGS